MGFSIVCISLLVVALLLPDQSRAGLLDRCHAQCREEEELKMACKIERNCESFLPDFGAVLICLEPCARLGTNCFQRCAFKTDMISSICQSRCLVSDVTNDVNSAQGGVSLPSEVGGSDVSDVSTNEQDNSEGTQCYKSCYDEMLNSAMNRLYRKRPGTE